MRRSRLVVRVGGLALRAWTLAALAQLRPRHLARQASPEGHCLKLLLLAGSLAGTLGWSSHAAAQTSTNAAAAAKATILTNLTPAELDWLRQNHTVRVRVTSFPPFIFLDKNEPEGIAVDLLKLIAERSGIRFVFNPETTPYQEAIESMAALRGPDLIPAVSRRPERTGQISFSADYVSSPRVIFTRTDGPFVSSVEDLRGKTLATARGSAAGLVQPSL